MRNFRELTIWKKGIEVTKLVYSFLPELPELEKFGLISQIIRAAISIPSNIAEECAKSSNKDFKRYLQISLGPAYELETQLIIINENYGLDTSQAINRIQEIEKMIVSFINKI